MKQSLPPIVLHHPAQIPRPRYLGLEQFLALLRPIEIQIAPTKRALTQLPNRIIHLLLRQFDPQTIFPNLIVAFEMAVIQAPQPLHRLLQSLA